MVRLRMQRFGRTHRPFYRINAIDIRTSRNGKVIENLGWYNPTAAEGQQEIELKEDRIRHWLAQGAKPSDTIRDMLGHRDLLSDKMKAEWEADRAKDRDRVACKQSFKKAEAALKELEALGESSDTDPAEMIEKAKAAIEICKRSISQGRTEQAEKAAAEVEAARDGLKKADDAKKATDAKAADEASTDDGSGESSEESAEG